MSVDASFDQDSSGVPQVKRFESGFSNSKEKKEFHHSPMHLPLVNSSQLCILSAFLTFARSDSDLALRSAPADTVECSWGLFFVQNDVFHAEQCAPIRGSFSLNRGSQISFRVLGGRAFCHARSCVSKSGLFCGANSLYGLRNTDEFNCGAVSTLQNLFCNRGRPKRV